MTDFIIKERLNSLDKSYANFLQSDFASEAAKNFGTQAKLDQNRITVLENGIILYLLFFLSLSELIDFISKECQLDHDNATELTYAIILVLPENYQEAHDEMVNKLRTDKNESSIANNTNPEPNHHIRTMAQDISNHNQEEAVYSSTQAAILKETKPKDESADRWGNATK